MSAPKGQTYKFSPLPSKSSIRLLRILSGPSEQVLRSSLEVVDLSDTPEPSYDCLSYTWGNPLYQKILPPQDGREITDERKFRIECDGLIICVAENLLEALSQLSRNGLESTSGPQRWQRQDRIWVDAICIHQEDMEERSSQVAMMERIYRQAQNVVVWLGPDDTLTELGIEVMQRLASVPPEKRELDLPDDLDNPEVYIGLGIPFCTPQDWLALATFLQRTWFSRVWVLQESFAARRIAVFCGTHVLNWTDITAASKTLGDTGLGRLLRERVERVTTTVIEETRYVANTLNNLYIFEEIRENAHSLSLETLLQYSRYFGASNKMDHVYAVLGMWERGPRQQTSSDSITPQYTLRVEDVFAKAALVSIREMGDLNLLSLVESAPFRSAEMSSLPSWVPDYTTTPFTEPLRGNPRPAEDEARWNASAGLEWEEPGALDLPLLPVRGIQVSTVTHRAATEAEIIDSHQEYTLLALLKHCLDAPSPYADPIDAWWRTLIKDTFQASPIGSREGIVEACRAFATLLTYWVWSLETRISELGTPLTNTPFHQTLTKAYSHLHSLIVHLSPIDKTQAIPSWSSIRSNIKLGEANVSETFDQDYEHIASSFRLAYMGRRLFVTASGHQGIGPQALEKGDEVWILGGAKVPMVLRRVQEGIYRLVGEAYVHGIMEGEAVGEGKGRKIYLQ
ncbi:Heterokaryon incompatibility protein (HET) domain containing protein [Hyaloscypha variabilis]